MANIESAGNIPEHRMSDPAGHVGSGDSRRAAHRFHPDPVTGLDVRSYLAQRYWLGPAAGQVVTQVSQGYASCLFPSFGRLTPADYTLPNGVLGRPHGEYELTTMGSLPAWTFTLKGRILATSESYYWLRESLLQRLLGRRLLSVQIDERSRSTVLTFTRALVLTTQSRGRDRRPHWLLRLSNESWPQVILNGTHSCWRGHVTTI